MGKIIKSGDHLELETKDGITYPLTVIEDIEPASWKDYHLE
ncbi:hypothetical protein [Crocosphaera sp. Alani8]